MLKKTKIFALFCAFLLPLFAFDNIKLVKKQLEEGVTIAIPEIFTEMPADVYQRKFGGYRKPLGMFSSPDGLATLGINTVVNRSLLAVAQSNWNEKDLKMLQGMYKGSISAMHDNITFIQEKVVVINKRNFIVFEFIGEVKEKDREGNPKDEAGIKQYSYIQYTIENNKIYVFNFNCPVKQKQKWVTTAKNVMESVKIKK